MVSVGSRTIVLEENCPSTNPKTNLNPNRNTNQGAIFLGGNCLVTPNTKINFHFDSIPIL